MTVADVKALVPKNATIRLANLKNETLDINENEYLTSKYDDREIETMYGERYPWIPALGTTLVLKETKSVSIDEVEACYQAEYLAERLFDEAAELRALFKHRKPSMIELNQVRALSCIDIATENLGELKKYFKALGV